MALIVVNPTPTKRRRKRAASQPKTKGHTAASKKGVPTMAKRRRSAAQRAATRRMLAARKHRNPSTHRRRRSVRRYAAPVHYRRRRTHRNPSTGGGILNELMSKDGLMMIAAVVGTPTITELAVQYLMPNSYGMTCTLVKAGIGLGLAYGVYRFLNKKAGMVVGLVSVGEAVSNTINSYMTPTVPTVAGLSASRIAAPDVVGGYLPAGSRRGMNLSGYAPYESGVVRMR